MPTIRIPARGQYDFEKLEPQIHSIYPTSPIYDISPIKYSTKEFLIPFVNKQIIGRDRIFQTPFGSRKVLYCDYTASGKGLECFEEFISGEVLPDYANTHTKATMSAKQTTAYRTEARDIIRRCTNAKDSDSVLFCGSGCTGAITKLIGCLQLTRDNNKPVVFTGPYEHHSNILPWREMGDCIRIRHTTSGYVDLAHLKVELKKWRKTGRKMIGCFSAGSNVTGILTDVDPITKLLHENGALAFWDYAACGPYVDIKLNKLRGADDTSIYDKDAIYLSVHKFIGGVETPGLLLAKNALFTNQIPSIVGGGTVLFVRREDHRYLKVIEEREDAGTPQIIGSIRAGLVFQLKADITSEVIMKHDKILVARAFERWSQCSDYLHILGSQTAERLPIFSFLVRHPQSGLLLHHDFICTLLNDLFGIQARSGCACAGPYAEDLMGITEERAAAFSQILDDCQNHDAHDKIIFKPGFTRLNLAYFLEDRTADFVIEAVAMVAEHAWRLLPQYRYTASTGEWRHASLSATGMTPATSTNSLKWINYRNKSTSNSVISGELPGGFQLCLNAAHVVFKDATKSTLPTCKIHVDPDMESVRWFLLPTEAKQFLRRTVDKLWTVPATRTLPFEPVKYENPYADKKLAKRLLRHIT